MRRREFIAGLAGAASWPLVAWTQQPGMPVVGVLRSTAAADFTRYVTAFREGLGEAGFVEGQNVAIEYRWANNQPDRLPEMAVDLVRRRVTVISTNGFATPAAMAATGTIPIVFTTGFDPVRTGLVASLSRPGGNVTGVVFTTTDLVSKQLGLLHELVPKAAVIAVLVDPNQPEMGIESREAEAAGGAIGRQILIVKAASEGEFNAAFATLVQAGAGALLVLGSPTFLARRRQLVVLASRHAMPASYSNSRIRGGRRPDELRNQPDGRQSPGWALCWRDS